MLAIFTIQFFSRPIFGWLKNYLLPCPFKYLTGIDCPGCGFQRSVIALIHGEFKQSFLLYPAAIPLLIVAAWWLADTIWKLDGQQHPIKKGLFISTSAVIIISYGIKMASLYLHL